MDKDVILGTVSLAVTAIQCLDTYLKNKTKNEPKPTEPKPKTRARGNNTTRGTSKNKDIGAKRNNAALKSRPNTTGKVKPPATVKSKHWNGPILALIGIVAGGCLTMFMKEGYQFYTSWVFLSTYVLIGVSAILTAWLVAALIGGNNTSLTRVK